MVPAKNLDKVATALSLTTFSPEKMYIEYDQLPYKNEKRRYIEVRLNLLEAKNFPKGGAEEEGFKDAFFSLTFFGLGSGNEFEEVEADILEKCSNSC